ncbi:uncharacterized protein LACBIDRAFT_333395 [Laccaria bicolor S238N-H82]|uniref:Predicted protein n=1 Tax=Laccaria bicolor (strain S238N-H82 / ATCC MYA-4686) TaxID=486041 RepID=B0DVS1_LACBS|nr:uncharacterized protein LACBIDRAFT_333395 [Laccaria bicolor S238N-H82]EDR01305.1 predicted protein [Laccaria bicolor S238N-H82]|eukprot:XP_001888012.1 predicted protein [Laccaria bicolor S238N-H82]
MSFFMIAMEYVVDKENTFTYPVLLTAHVMPLLKGRFKDDATSSFELIHGIKDNIQISIDKDRLQLKYPRRMRQLRKLQKTRFSCFISLRSVSRSTLLCQEVRHTIANQPNGPAIETLLRNIEDFVRLHTPVFRQILATAISHSPSFDFREKFALVLLGKSDLAKSDRGNPARAFFVESADFVDMPIPGDHESYGRQLTAMRPAAERFEEKERGAEGYLGLLMCLWCKVSSFQIKLKRINGFFL